MLDHGHAGQLDDSTDQRLATARDHQINAVVHLHKFADRLAVGGPDQLHHLLRQPRLGGADGQRLGDGLVRLDRLASAAEDHRVAGLQAEGGGIGGDVGTRLVDDGDDADRHALLENDETVGTAAAADATPDRIGQVGHLAQSADDAVYTLVGQRQAIQHGRHESGLPSGLEVELVGGLDQVTPRINRGGHGTQGAILAPCADCRHTARRLAGRVAHAAHRLLQSHRRHSLKFGKG